MENYLKNGNLPKAGEIVISDYLFSDLKITNMCFEYKRNEGENFTRLWKQNSSRVFAIFI